MKQYIYAGVAALLIAGCIGGYFYGVKVTNTKWVAKTQTAINEAVAEARAAEKAKQDKVNEILQNQVNDLSDINTQLNDDIVGLRDRASRRNVSRDAPIDCQGTDGRSLSGQDAEFLTREAARADRLRKALIGCYEYADMVTGKSE